MKSKKNTLVTRRALWESDPGQYLVGREFINAVDELQNSLNAKWGRGRLRLLANPELRAKYDRQCELYNSAVWYGTIDDLRSQTDRMQKALRALERSAVEAGHQDSQPPFWSVKLSDGRTLHMVREMRDTWALPPGDVIWSLEEVARLIEAQDAITTALKGTFKGAEIIKVQTLSPLDPKARFVGNEPEEIR